MGDVLPFGASNARTPPRPPTPLFCARPGCGLPLPARNSGAGRKRRYCDDQCSRLYLIQKRAAKANLETALAILEQYGNATISRRVLKEDLEVMRAALVACDAALSHAEEHASPSATEASLARATSQSRAALALAVRLLKH